ncbi:tyrosine-type recombinase/integrase [Pelovirga terrestris]|uniref:Tyrosine-type recombinase/integrase n=1 Tax=Pelovirga terrestris TaxID=2771352 RepID=A0A8J6QVG0_9BACT|nr:site-specific integrase [Pelovirga terrestris]MBD1401660.1 tyrosine-type recombinase/integrase [Pelovirga terrestris]
MRRFPFTKKALEALPPQDPDSVSREAEYSDSDCIGLKLRVSKGGRKFFQHRYRYLGRKKCLTLGEFPHVSLQEARKMVSEHKALLARTIDPSEERQQKQLHLTFAQFTDQMYLPHAMSHKRTWKNDQYALNARILPALGKYRLSSITARDITLFHSQVKEKTSATSANHYLILVKRMFNLSVMWGLLEKSPATGLEKFKQPPLRERYLEPEELPRFLKALEEQDEDQLSVAAIKLLLFTGCRKNEILSLQWHQVRLEEGMVFLPLTKNGRSRTVILNTKAMEVMRELARNNSSDYVFPSRAGTRKGYIYDLRKPFEKVCDAAGISGLRVHDLRHSFASIAIASGASLYDVQKLLGHSDPSMTQRYAHLSKDSLQKATEKVSQMLEMAGGL